MSAPTILPAEGIRKVRVELAEENLQIIGAPNPTITIRCSDETLSLRQDGDTLTLSAEDDLTLFVPAGISLEARSVEGDVDARAFMGALAFDSVEGDVQIRNAGAVSITSVEGDVMIKNISGSVSIANCEADVTIKDVAGSVSVMADGDLNLTNIGGNLNARCDGDLSLNQTVLNGNVNCQASGDAVVQLPEEVDATVFLSAGSPPITKFRSAGQKFEKTNTNSFILGSGTHAMRVVVEGSLLVTGPNAGGGMWGGIPDLSGLEESINSFVDETVEKALNGLPKIDIDEAKINAKLHKVEDAMRKVEEKIRSAERRARHSGWRATGGQGKPPVEPPPAPVSSEEHMAVLRMLQEKKITIEEAETLLSALEGRS